MASVSLPITNNVAEQALRHWVIARKISHGTRTAEDSRAYTLLASVIDTCRQRGVWPWPYMAQVIAERRQGKVAPPIPQTVARVVDKFLIGGVNDYCFAYNWALAEWQRQYEAGERSSEISLRKQLNSLKREQFPGMYEVTKSAPQQAIKNSGTAFNRFFTKQGSYPCFKKKGVHDSFRADNGPTQKGEDAVRVNGKRIKLARIGWVKMRETVRFQRQIKSVTISKQAGYWFAAINIDMEDLNVSGMLKNRHLSRAIADQSFGEFRRQISYKSDWYGSELAIYPRFKPSSKMCCQCGQIHEMPLSKRTISCTCGNTIDRDLNATI